MVKPVLLTLHFPPPCTDVIMLSRPAKFNSSTRASISQLARIRGHGSGGYVGSSTSSTRGLPSHERRYDNRGNQEQITHSDPTKRARQRPSPHITSRPPTSHPPYLRHANGEYWQPCAKRTRYRHSHAESCLHANHVRDRHRLIVLQCKPSRTCEM